MCWIGGSKDFLPLGKPKASLTIIYLGLAAFDGNLTKPCEML